MLSFLRLKKPRPEVGDLGCGESVSAGGGLTRSESHGNLLGEIPCGTDNDDGAMSSLNLRDRGVWHGSPRQETEKQDYRARAGVLEL